MTQTLAIDLVSSASTESVTTVIAPKSSMTPGGSSTDPKTGRVTTIYNIASSDGIHVATVRYQVDPIAAGAKTRYGSVTFSTWVTSSDSVTGIITWFPIQATVSFVIQNGSPVVLADFNKLIAATFSFAYASVSSGTRDTAYLQRLLLGSATVV